MSEVKSKPVSVYDLIIKIGICGDHPSYQVTPGTDKKNLEFFQINAPIQLEWLEKISFCFSYSLGELIEMFVNLSNEDIDHLYTKYKAIEFSKVMNNLEITKLEV
jgi:hypothetical protein